MTSSVTVNSGQEVQIKSGQGDYEIRPLHLGSNYRIVCIRISLNSWALRFTAVHLKDSLLLRRSTKGKSIKSSVFDFKLIDSAHGILIIQFPGPDTTLNLFVQIFNYIWCIVGNGSPLIQVDQNDDQVIYCFYFKC